MIDILCEKLLQFPEGIFLKPYGDQGKIEFWSCETQPHFGLPKDVVTSASTTKVCLLGGLSSTFLPNHGKTSGDFG